MFSPENSALVGGLGLIIGLAGLAVSLLGFSFTIQQLRRTSKATEAVTTAIGKLRNRMAAFDYATECLRATKSLEHATQLLRGRNLEDAAGRLLEAQGILNRIGTSNQGTLQTRQVAKETAELLLEVVQNLEEAVDKDLKYETNEITLTLRKQINLLDVELLSVNKDIYDV